MKNSSFWYSFDVSWIWYIVQKYKLCLQRSAWVEIAKELRFAVDCTAGDSKPNPDKEGPTSASRSTSKGGSKSLLDDHSHPYGIIEDKERDSAYAQFNESVSAK